MCERVAGSCEFMIEREADETEEGARYRERLCGVGVGGRRCELSASERER